MTTFQSRFSQIIGNEKPYAWASRHGVAKATVSNVLNKDGLPSADQLKKISDSTGVSIDWLLTGEGPMYRERVNQAGGSYAERREALGLSEEASMLLDIYFDLPRDLRKKFIAGMRMMLDLDRYGKDKKVKALLDLIEKAG